MFLLQDSGEVNIRRHFLMSECLILILMHLIIVISKYPLFINVFNVRNNRSTHEQCIREIEMGSL